MSSSGSAPRGWRKTSPPRSTTLIEHHSTPAHHDPATSIVLGSIADSSSRHRIAGAVITLIAATGETLQTLSDDAGRYRFDPVAPGTYIVSAYYSVDGHGQIELRRGDLAVAAGHGIRVPLWVETRP